LELPDSRKAVPLTSTDIKLSYAGFSYTGKANEKALKDVNLIMAQGSFTALVRLSGGGKSMVASLIALFGIE
jgi:ABC-type multidrug transport system fused ATPase/permease subunit